MLPASRFLLLACAGLLAGCAVRSDQVAPVPTAVQPLLDLSCTQLRGALDGVEQQAEDLAFAVDAQRGNNLIALGVGVMAFWPALMVMRGNEQQAAELALLKGEHEALLQAMAGKQCAREEAPDVPKLPDDGVHRGLPAAGDRYTYQEFEPISGQPAGRSEWRLRTVKPGRLEYVSGDDTMRWTTDAAGNWRSGAVAGLRLLRFLRADAVPGQQLEGEVGTGDVQDGIGRLQGRVTALLTHELEGRRFEAARIELQGHVPSNVRDTQSPAAGSERIEGWLVVERRTGQVLQAEVRSGNPAFAWRRRLVRFVRAQ